MLTSKKNQESRIRNHDSRFMIHDSKTESLPRIMLVDMNSFFASVEQQANPFLRGKPVGVCASAHETSCLIATSKEAKALGIRTGTVIYKARKIYPKIILCPSEPEKYREVSRAINKIFRDYTDQVEPYSIDESFLELSSTPSLNPSPQGGGKCETFGLGSSCSSPLMGEARWGCNPLLIAIEIKRRIREEVGEWLTCSIGIAPNKFMAKLAAEMQKPDGLSVVWQSQLREIYKSLKLSDLWGISRGWTRRLGKLGIISPIQILDYPVQNLIAVFGKPGFFLWQRVNGLEEDEVRNEEEDPKSFGHSWVLNFRTTDKEKLKVVVLRLAEKAARRMRRRQFVAFEIYISALLADGSYFRRTKRLKFAVDTGLQLYSEALKIWENWEFKKEVMHIAVGFTSLQRSVSQLALFGDKQADLTSTLDRINNKYGEFTIRSSLLTRTSDFAPDAIAFSK